jgi:hypothetical protein
MSEKINVLIGANIEGLKTALAESGKSLSDFGTLAQQAPKRVKTAVDQLNQSYRDAVRDAKNLYLAQGQTSEAFHEAELKVKNLKVQIQQLNDVVGQTGQIAAGSGGAQQATRGFDMLGNSVNQLTREMPAFTYSMQTGFMAISNNIPMFVDQINNVRRANEGLIAQGKPVQSVFSQLATAIFSWNSAISIGVTLLSVYGEKLINFFTGAKQSKQALEDLTNSQNDLNEKIKLYLMTDQEKEIYQEAKAHKEVTDGIKARIKETVVLKDQYGRVSDEIRALTFEEVLANEQAKQDLITAEIRYQERLLEIKQNYAKKPSTEYDLRMPVVIDLKEGVREGFFLDYTTKQIQKKLKLWRLELGAELQRGMTPIDISDFVKSVEKPISELEKRIGGYSDLIAEALSGIGVAIGQALVTGDLEDGARSVLKMLGQIAIKIGSAMIAIGIPMLASVITAAEGKKLIGGGIALTIVGGAMIAGANIPKKSSTQGGGGGSSGGYSSGSSGGDIPSFNPTGMMISIDGLVRGNNIVVALDNQTRMNRRVR